MNSDSVPTSDDVKRIAAIKDHVIRNLQITQCYYEISSVLATRLCFDVNWCTFATWASKQAGQTIRKEDLLNAISNLLKIHHLADPAFIKIISSVLRIGSKYDDDDILKKVCKALSLTSIDRTSIAVAKGNKKVFEEIGFEFARFISTCFQDQTYFEGNIQKFCNELKPGLPPDGQQYLRQAFTRYYKSLFESDNKNKAELILLANLEVGFHEQTRLQPEIADALNAAILEPKEFRNNLIDTIFPSFGWFNKIRIFFLWLFRRLSKLDAAVEPIVKTIRQHLRLIITEHLMSITFPPDMLLNLGRDLKAEFPAVLKIIENKDLNLLLNQIDPTPDNPIGSGALDWTDFPERMHFITDLFRCYQQSSNLFEKPFNDEQVIKVKSGMLPTGNL